MVKEIDAVVDALDRRNYAILPGQDLLGPGHQLWLETVRFMADFAQSDAAARHEAEYRRHLEDNLRLDRREAETLAALNQARDKAQVAYDGAAQAYAKAQQARDAQGFAKTKLELQDAKRALKDAAGRAYTTAKDFQRERSALNSDFKPYIFEGDEYLGRRLRYSDPPVLLASHPVFLEIARRYLGEAAKIRTPVVWRVPRVPPDLPPPNRKGSQSWHRDQTDTRILKLFMYFSDVDEGSGALEFIPDSGPVNSKWAEALPYTGTTGYVPKGLVERLVPPEEIVRCSGKIGTFVFVDTAGLHRGGYALKAPRVITQATYLRQQPKHPLSPLMPEGHDDPNLTPEQRFAYS